jgi:hypothetical protein
MSSYDFVKKHGVTVLEDGELSIKLDINGSHYLIFAQSGRRAKRTERMVKRLLGPQMTKAQALNDKAFKAMDRSARDELARLQKIIAGKQEGHEQALADLDALISAHLTTDDVESMLLGLYDSISPDDEEALDFALFEGIESVQHGKLHDPSVYDKHFDRTRRKNIDILRDVVIEYNDFLGLNESRP